ncbi:MAG: efflux RND transporter periplasmic adaptor subunit [Planctomycetota bacterium]|nr:efflux RND transporter periplasmic adaptor subunit [Planctomycetota bacterium]
MILKYVLPLLAILGFAFAVHTVAQGSKPVVPAKPVAEPARSPFASVIAGAGIVEARTQNIAVGTPVPGVVVAVEVAVGDTVAAGAPLFRLDDRERAAQHLVKLAQLAQAQSELARLEALPRAEDVPVAEARLTASDALLADATKQLDLAESLTDKRAIATQEWDRRRFAVLTARARAAESTSELAKLKAGAWAPELAAARAKVAAAQAEVDAARTELDRLVVRAPVGATVLQVNVRKGEFATAGALATPLMLLGDISVLHVRVDVDENDVWRLKSGARAEACVRGNRSLRTDLEFVRIDPYVVPKRSLTGESTERVDTRVLQVLFRFDPKVLPVYVGQQMDVFIEAPGDVGGGAR